MRFNKVKSKFVHLGWSSPTYEYRLGDELQVNSSEEKDFRVLMYEKLDISQ